jgi:fatty acid desaturase
MLRRLAAASGIACFTVATVLAFVVLGLNGNVAIAVIVAIGSVLNFLVMHALTRTAYGREARRSCGWAEFDSVTVPGA